MKFTFSITRQDFIDFNQFYFVKNQMKKSIILIVFSNLILFYISSTAGNNLLATCFFLFLFSAFYVFLIKRRINKTGDLLEKNGSVLGEKEYELTDEKINYKTQDFEGSMSWNSIIKMEESKTAIYLFTDSIMAVIFPKRIFKSEKEQEEFKNLVSNKLAKKGT